MRPNLSARMENIPNENRISSTRAPVTFASRANTQLDCLSSSFLLDFFVLNKLKYTGRRIEHRQTFHSEPAARHFFFCLFPVETGRWQSTKTAKAKNIQDKISGPSERLQPVLTSASDASHTHTHTRNQRCSFFLNLTIWFQVDKLNKKNQNISL